MPHGILPSVPESRSSLSANVVPPQSLPLPVPHRCLPHSHASRLRLRPRAVVSHISVTPLARHSGRPVLDSRQQRDLAAHHAQHCRAVLPALASILAWHHQGRQHSAGCRSTAEASFTAETVDAKDDEPDESAKEDLPTDNIAEIASVQTPASVWLPSKGASGHQDKVESRAALQLGPAIITLKGKVARSFLLLMRIPSWIRSLLAFKAQQIMLASTMTKITAVFVIGIPLCFLGGILYSWTSGKGLIDGFINAYGALYKIPGVTVIGEVNQLTSHLMNILWLFGTFTFAIVLGVVTEDIVATVVNVRSGNYPVVAQNHTLVLNWNSQTVPLLRQIAINKVERANATYDGPVVVLAERDKEEMDKELREALKGYALEWHTRMGAPHNLSDLARVAAGQAKTVILLDPDDSEDVGKKQVAALLGVQTARASTRPRPFLRLMPQNFAVQSPQKVSDRGIWDSAKAIMEASAQRFNLTDLSTRRDMSMLLAQSAVQPGVASVYCSIVQQTRKGVEFYIKGFKELEGLNYRAVRRSFDRAVICGVLKKDGDLTVNPDDDDLFEEGDRLVALANTGFFKPSKDFTESMTYGEYEDQPDPVGTSPKAVVVAWWDEDITDLARSLSIFLPRGSVVKVISAEKPEGFPDEQSKLLVPGCRFTHVEGDPANAENLRSAGAAGAQAIIIGGLQRRPAKESDALTISVILLLQEVLMNSDRDAKYPAHIVGMVRQPETVEVANFLIARLGKSTVTAELMHPDELVSGILSQVAAEPEMARLLAGFIYSTEGHEIYLRRPSRYQLLEDMPMAFAEVAELCRMKCETAIGYITAAGNLKLAPPAREQLKYTKDDRIVVIADG